MFSVQAVVDAILSVTGGSASHHQPVVTDDDVLAIADQARRLDSYHHVNLLQERLKERIQVKHAVAVSSGTAALELALHLVGVKRGDTVLLPTLSFVAAANAVIRAGAVPVFLDSSKHDLGISPHLVGDHLARHERPAAIIAVHLLGHPCAISIVNTLADLYGVPVIEDAAEAVGSSVCQDGREGAWRPCGSWGIVSVLSFNLNKVVTAGGGGALLTDDDDLGEKAHHLATTARVAHPWLVEHDAVGWNHRMPMLSAALCGEQVKRLDGLVKAKRALAMAYRTAISGMDGVTFHEEPAGTVSNFWLPTILVPPGERDAVLTALHDKGVMARAMFTPMHRLKMYQDDDDGAFPVADEIFARAICLPAGIDLARRFV